MSVFSVVGNDRGAGAYGFAVTTSRAIRPDIYREATGPEEELLLTHTAEYALRVVLHIAGAAKDGPVRVDSAAAALEVPRNYLSKVMHVLAKTGVLHSTRGPNGGFTLGRPATQITLAQVIEEFDPIEDRCLLMQRKCSDATPCIAHHEWKHVAVRMRGFFRETTVDDLIQGAAGATPAGFDLPAPAPSGAPDPHAPSPDPPE